MMTQKKATQLVGVFYKYRRFPGPRDRAAWKRLEDLFVRRELHFPSPGTLNDPFDCYPRLGLTASKSGLKQKATALYVSERVRVDGKTHEEILASKDLRTGVDNVIRNLRSPAVRLSALSNAIDSCTGIYCMSRRPDSILQWSYYGGDHAGFCLEFTVPRHPKPPFDHVMAVTYVSRREPPVHRGPAYSWCRVSVPCVAALQPHPSLQTP